MSAQRQTTGGKQDVQKTERQKGLHLVELIVVLVILAILAALLIPALTGYIDKANKEKIVAETRMVVMAAQTEASSGYGTLKSDATGKAAAIAKYMQDNGAELMALVEVDGNFNVTVDDAGKITDAVYSNNGYTCVYDADGTTAYDVKKDADAAETADGHKVNGTAITE